MSPKDKSQSTMAAPTMRKERMFQCKSTSWNQNGDGSGTNMESARICGYQLGARRMVISDASVIHVYFCAQAY